VDPLGNVYVANQEQRPGHLDYAIRKFSPTGEDFGDFVVMSKQPRCLVVLRSTHDDSAFC